jgi:tetratricopeptide (TPR) repeat protein
MIPRLVRGFVLITFALAFVIPPAIAGRGGRGGGGGGGRGGGGGMPRGGGGGGMPRGGGGGGMPRGGGGGISRSPAVSSPRSAQRPAMGGGAGGRPSTLPSRPSGGAGRPGAGPGAGRPSTLPSGPGLGNRPQIGGQPGIGNRPGVGGQPGIGNRPGVGGQPGIGNRPGVGGQPGIGNRPGIDNRPGVGNRPGIDNRPGVGNRPGIDNRPGGGTNLNRPVDPGYGARTPAYNGWRGAYSGYHQGWANGYWHGYHENNNWGWGAFGLGAVTGVSAWALGSSFYNWGYASYANPYYGAEAVAQPIVFEQTVAGGEPQTMTVPAYTYDYSQPIDTQSAPPPDEVANPALAKFDSARAAFGTGDYAGALKLTDDALKVLQNDATLHEFRALVLFAVGKYDLAAGPLYAVLSVGPGWDWTTMAGLYSDIDVYTSQLRKLEAFVTANPNSTTGRFVLAYHYLTQGNTDAAVSQLKAIVALTPQDTLSAQLVKQFSPQAAAPDTAAATTASPPVATTAKQGNLAGNWTAHPAGDTTIDLRIGDDETFTWKVTAKGKPRQLTGKWSLTDNVLTLAQEGDAGALVGRVSWQAGDKWSFRVIGTGAEDQGLLFTH